MADARRDLRCHSEHSRGISDFWPAMLWINTWLKVACAVFLTSICALTFCSCVSYFFRRALIASSAASGLCTSRCSLRNFIEQHCVLPLRSAPCKRRGTNITRAKEKWLRVLIYLESD